MNQPKCDVCGGATRSIGSAAPTADDLAGGAHRVELYECKQCRAPARFPRYNDARRLLRTRRGRCGEWANAFTLFCRALGFHARYVLDVTDHVWTEVWSARRARWLHCDPCENKLDAPLMYSVGWRKPLSFAFAFAPGEAADVIHRYVDKNGSAPVVARRAAVVSQAYVAARLRLLDTQRRAALPAAEQRARDERRAPDDRELAAPADPRPVPSAAETGGRETGSVEWRAARGELGSGSGSCGLPPRAPSHEWLARLPAGGGAAGGGSEGGGEWRLRYSAARDCYFEGGPEGAPPAGAQPALAGWRAGAAAADNMKRAVEDDWNMVYLARASAAAASVEWRVRAQAGARIVGGRALLAHSLHAEGAAVRWRLSRDDGHSWRGLAAPQDAPVSLTRALAACDARGVRSAVEPRDGCCVLRLRAELGGGTWQSAQLFRQSRTQLDAFLLDLRLVVVRDEQGAPASAPAAAVAAAAPAADVPTAVAAAAPAAVAAAGNGSATGGGTGSQEDAASALRARFARLFEAVSAEEGFRDDPTAAAAEAIRRMSQS